MMKTGFMGSRLQKSVLGVVAAVGFMAMMPLSASAHCDTVDGPTVADGNLSPLKNLIEEEKMPELKERFERVLALENFDANDLAAGREYIEAYVSFFKFAEGEEEHHGADPHQAAVSHHEAGAHKAAK